MERIVHDPIFGEMVEIELTQTFGNSQPTLRPEDHFIASFEDGIAKIESGEIGGFECFAGGFVLSDPHPMAAIYRIRRWGENGWQFKPCRHGREGSGIYTNTWQELFRYCQDIIDEAREASFRAI
jgi:hypothetical protein